MFGDGICASIQSLWHEKLWAMGEGDGDGGVFEEFEMGMGGGGGGDGDGKECVLKKRKLNESNERKITLLDEIRFLKQRRDLLLKQQYQNSEQTQESAGKTNAETSRRYLSGTPASTSTSGQAFHHPRPPMIPISKMGSGSGSKEEAAFAPLNLRKKAKSLFNNGKRAEKRKISWQDQLALKV